MSKRHRLAGKGPLPIEELDDEPLIAFRKGSSARLAMDEALAAAGTTPSIRLEGSDLSLIRGLAARGFGAAILPARSRNFPASRFPSARSSQVSRWL